MEVLAMSEGSATFSPSTRPLPEGFARQPPPWPQPPSAFWVFASQARPWLATGLSGLGGAGFALGGAASVVASAGFSSGAGVVAATAVGDAGVDIYRYASKIGGMTRFRQNNTARRNEIEKMIASPTAEPAEKEAAKKELAEIARADEDQQVLLDQVAEQVKDKGFVAGFGNNGGEEFLSFINIGEALHAKGGEDWIEWEKQMAETIAEAQNEDGSWAGQHCITGRTFCTATALMVLMSDRAPVPQESAVAAKPESAEE